MLPLALTSTLSLVLAVGGGAATTEEHSVAPEPTPTPPKAVTDTPSRPEPKHKGTGLLVATGVFGVTAFSVTVARNAILKKNCPLSDSMPVAACTYDFGSDIGLAATQWVSNIVTVSLAPAAGTVLGRYHAWKDTSSGKQRNAKALMGAGGGLIGAGVVGVGTSIALAFVLPARCVEKELDGGDPLAGDRCLLKAFPAWTMTNWASFAMIGAGGGMLGYGNAYRRSRPAMASLRFAPSAGPTYAGFGVSGRF